MRLLPRHLRSRHRPFLHNWNLRQFHNIHHLNLQLLKFLRRRRLRVLLHNRIHHAPAPSPTPKLTSSRATTTKMETNINKILDNHLHQITAAFQSSLHASPAPRPPVPVPDPDPPQPIPPSSSHGAPPSRSHRTTTPTLWHRRSRSPRHSRHRSQHRHQLPALCDPELTARNIAAHQAQTDVAPPVVILHFVVVISLVKPSRHHRKLYTSKALCHAAPITLWQGPGAAQSEETP